MKKLILTILFLILPVFCFAAGSSHTVTSDKIYRNKETGSKLRVITCSFTADDTNASVPDLTLNASTTNINSPIIGWWAYKIRADGDHAGTEPTDDTVDMTINEGGKDLLNGNGTNIFDQDDETEKLFEVDGLEVMQPCTGTWTISIANNAVNEATVTYEIIFIGYGAGKGDR